MTESRNLFEQLHKYSQSDYYPYHMPGHKRRQLGALPEEILGLDITEIEGFDNLHQPKGILQDLQKQVSRLYGADESFYLINGSTCGILSAVSAALPEGGHLLMARGCHKSAYHAAYLRNLRITYLYGDMVEGFDFEEAITPSSVKKALDESPDADAVLIVSPTYEGRIAKIAEIAQIVHEKGIPLIVDEAHGAHLGFAEGFAKGSCSQGADLVIHSVHKTLPSMTQTALLHVNGELVDRQRLKRFLHIYQSSSPSYVLMAGIADSMEIVEKQGVQLLEEFRQQYHTMYERLQACRALHFIPFADVESGVQDIGKLVISTAGTDVSGQWLLDTLLEQYHLQCEMSAGNYCLAMFTLADGKEAYERMTEALIEIDALLAKEHCLTVEGQQEELEAGQLQEQSEKVSPGPIIKYPLTKAWNSPWELTRLSEAIGRPVAEFVNLYPPGIPLLVPGEIFTEALYGTLLDYQKKGLNIQGILEGEDESLIPTIKL